MVVGWAVGKELDTLFGFGEASPLDTVRESVQNLNEILSHTRELTEQNREKITQLKEVLRTAEYAIGGVRDGFLDVEEARAALTRKIEQNVGSTNQLKSQVVALNERLYDLERQNQEAYRVAINNRNRIERLEGRIIGVEGNLESLRDEVGQLGEDVEAARREADQARNDATEASREAEKARKEAEKLRNSLRHTVEFSLAAAYTSFQDTPNEGLFGGEGTFQLNFLRVFSVAMLYNFDQARPGLGPGASARVLDHRLSLGLGIRPLGPRSPIRFQATAGPSILIREVRTGNVALSSEDYFGLAWLLRGDIAIGPPQWPVVPFVGSNITILAQPDRPETGSLALGTWYWSAIAGLRIRWKTGG
jgi:uncharacterized protein YoxC